MNHIAWTKRKAAIALLLCVIIAVSSVMFLQNNQTTQAALVNPHPGLVGSWNFDEGSGTIAGDGSGNGNNGTLINGPTWVIGKYGNALSFNGVGNYVNVVASSSLNYDGWSSITISGWFINSAPQVSIRMINLGYPSVGVDGSGRLYFELHWQDNSAKSITTTLPTDSQWHFVVGTYDGSTQQMYLDGVLVGQNSKIGTLLYIASGVQVGSKYGSSEFYSGIIDDVRIYNRALSASEIQTAAQQNPDFSSYIVAKVPSGTTQVIATLSWQGNSNINITLVSPSQTFTESTVPVYQKTTYSSSGGVSSMLNIKRLSISINALASDQNWNVTLTFDNPAQYQISVEVQK
jgi:hypothetical protein